MKTAKDCADYFSAMDKDEPVGLFSLDKSDVMAKLDGLELEDENGNPIESESIVTNSFVEKVINRIADDEYLWDRFSETLSDVITDLVGQELKEINEDNKLWDTEEKQNETK